MIALMNGMVQMKYSIPILVCILFAGFCFGKQPVKVKSGQIYIYKTSSGKAMKDSISKGDEAFLLQEGRNFAKIKTARGVVGWVQKSDIEYMTSSLGDKYNLENQDVRGWLDNPHALYIFDEAGLKAEALLLTRTFENEIFEFIDREIMERANDEN
jgi:hypothetical protein